MNQASDTGKQRRLYWRSRRGMLELDLLLLPFTLEAWAGLSPAEQAEYEQLLAGEDQELFAWLVKREPAGRWQGLVDRILAYNEAKADL